MFAFFTPDCNSFFYSAIQHALPAPWSPSISDWQTKLRCGGRRGGRRLGIGRDSANDVGADGDGADAIANINNVCFVGGREDDDDQSGRGRRRFIQQTQKMGEKCDERASAPTWLVLFTTAVCPNRTGVFIRLPLIASVCLLGKLCKTACHQE